MLGILLKLVLNNMNKNKTKISLNVKTLNNT